MTKTIQQHSLETIRLRVLTFFLCQGLCFASWASRIPDIKDAMGVSDAAIWGVILFLIPVGKFLAIPLAGYTVSKFGSRIMVQVAILGYALSLFAVGFSSSIYMLGACLFCFGIFWNLTDISLNTQAIGIEKTFGRTIMGSFHGAWSLAACVGAIVGFGMINLDVPYTYHFIAIFALIALSWILNRSALQDDVKTATEDEVAPEAANKNPENANEENAPKPKFKMPELVLIQLGLIGLFALIVESAMFDWGNVYFESIVKADKSLQIGFIVFMVMMTSGRFLMNKAYQLIGKQHTVQLAGILLFVGMFISALFPNIVLCSLGFMLVGLGISCMVPTIYSVVGEKSKMPTSIALTILSTISFVGSLIAPLLIGSITSTLNMKYAYMVVGTLGLMIVALATFTKAMKEQS